METLTAQQIARQDEVDNRIFELINDLIPSDKKLVWDIEMIGAIRDLISKEIIARVKLTEEEFYPYSNISPSR